jgi:hypothetical protein
VGVTQVEEVEDAVGVDPHAVVLLFLRLPARGADVLFFLVLVGEGILGGNLGLLSFLRRWRRAMPMM